MGSAACTKQGPLRPVVGGEEGSCGDPREPALASRPGRVMGDDGADLPLADVDSTFVQQVGDGRGSDAVQCVHAASRGAASQPLR